MSFFNEFIDSFSFEDISENKISVCVVFGLGVKIVGNLKIDEMNEDKIVLARKKDKIAVVGTGLEITTLAKGEIEINGNVIGVSKI